MITFGRLPRLATTLALLLLYDATFAAQDAPVFQRDLPDSREPQISVPATETGLAALGGETFTALFRLRLPQEAANMTFAAWQTADRKQGFRLHTKTGEPTAILEFEAAFDWKHPRNNHALRVAAPLRALRADQAHDILIRFTGPKLDLLIDGVLMDEEWPVGRIAPPAAEPLLLTTGNLQKVVFWNRALTDDEIAQLSGGPQKIAGREREMLGPPRPLAQYWKPPGWNTGVGDCMPFFHEGRFHLYYLFDRRGHASKWGLGAHQWAHASTTDLIEWTQHPMAVPISRQEEGSICTGSLFFSGDKYHAFYAVRTADGSPARLTSARSKDGIHFEKSDWSIALREPYSGPPARDPVVFRDPGSGLFEMLVTTELLAPPLAGRGGCLATLVSKDLRAWEQREPFIVPGFRDQPECPDYFTWDGWRYLIFSNNGVARYRMAREPDGPWLKPKSDAFDGPQARVMKTAQFTNGRRLGAVFLPATGSGYGGDLVFREIVRHTDGTLGTAFPAELRPRLGAAVPVAFEPLSGGVTAEAQRVEIKAGAGFAAEALRGLPADFHLKMTIIPATATGSFGLCVRGSGAYAEGHELRFEPAREKAGWRKPDTGTLPENEHSAIYGVDGLDRPFTVELVAKGDLLDVCIDGRRTLIVRAAGSARGDRLFLFAQDGGAVFDALEIHTLAESP